MSNPKRSYNFLRIKSYFFILVLAVELAPFGNIEIDGDKYPQDLSYSVSTVYCETPEEKWNPSPDIHLGKLEHWFSIFLVMSPHIFIYI
ncbi:hypothetical protein Avbf_08726 [Armadillidium vulgare]|nr:hypothetical protein Avbf_08726 [Armadillidium vulgare]